MQWDDINNLKQRLIHYDYDEIIDMLDISIEELVERFEHKIDPERLYYIAEEPDGEEDVGGSHVDDDSPFSF